MFNTPTLYPDQLQVLERLALMKFKLSSIQPSPVIFIQPTGGGKSLIRDVHYVLLCGVSLMIVPIFSLDVDQKRKVI